MKIRCKNPSIKWVWGEAAVALRSYVFPARGPGHADHMVELIHTVVVTTWDLYKMDTGEEGIC